MTDHTNTTAIPAPSPAAEISDIRGASRRCFSRRCGSASPTTGCAPSSCCSSSAASEGGGLGIDDRARQCDLRPLHRRHVSAVALRRLDRRPAHRRAARGVVGRHSHHDRQRAARHRANAAVLPRPRGHRVRRRTAEAEHQRHRRADLSGRRLAARCRLLHLLHGHQPRRVTRLQDRADSRGRLSVGERVSRRPRWACCSVSCSSR